MGMPTSVRDKTGTSYLHGTLTSLGECVTPAQREAKQFIIVLFLVDKESSKRTQIVDEVVAKHGDLIDQGLLQILEVGI